MKPISFCLFSGLLFMTLFFSGCAIARNSRCDESRWLDISKEGKKSFEYIKNKTVIANLGETKNGLILMRKNKNDNVTLIGLLEPSYEIYLVSLDTFAVFKFYIVEPFLSQNSKYNKCEYLGVIAGKSGQVMLAENRFGGSNKIERESLVLLQNTLPWTVVEQAQTAYQKEEVEREKTERAERKEKEKEQESILVQRRREQSILFRKITGSWEGSYEAWAAKGKENKSCIITLAEKEDVLGGEFSVTTRDGKKASGILKHIKKHIKMNTRNGEVGTWSAVLEGDISGPISFSHKTETDTLAVALKLSDAVEVNWVAERASVAQRRQAILEELERRAEQVKKRSLLKEKSTLVFKGFYLGMPIQDTADLLNMYSREIRYKVIKNPLGLDSIQDKNLYEGDDLVEVWGDASGVTSFSLGKNILELIFASVKMSNEDFIQQFSLAYGVEFSPGTYSWKDPYASEAKQEPCSLIQNDIQGYELAIVTPVGLKSGIGRRLVLKRYATKSEQKKAFE